jgi:hypothetical protein
LLLTSPTDLFISLPDPAKKLAISVKISDMVLARTSGLGLLSMGYFFVCITVKTVRFQYGLTCIAGCLAVIKPHVFLGRRHSR